MPAETTSPRLTSKFVEPVQYAAQKHATQTRKGSDIPYLGHLLSVAGLVVEADGTETEAIAALLHDAAEDQGGEETMAEIRQKFCADVATIVAECSDTFETPKPPWRERKESYIRHLPDALDGARSSFIHMMTSRIRKAPPRRPRCPVWQPGWPRFAKRETGEWCATRKTWRGPPAFRLSTRRRLIGVFSHAST